MKATVILIPVDRFVVGTHVIYQFQHCLVYHISNSLSGFEVTLADMNNTPIKVVSDTQYIYYLAALYYEKLAGHIGDDSEARVITRFEKIRDYEYICRNELFFKVVNISLSEGTQLEIPDMWKDVKRIIISNISTYTNPITESIANDIVEKLKKEGYKLTK
jgi:hypothetical protein